MHARFPLSFHRTGALIDRGILMTIPQLRRKAWRVGMRTGRDFALGLAVFTVIAAMVGVQTSDAFPAPVLLPVLSDPDAIRAVVSGLNMAADPATAPMVDFNVAAAVSVSPSRMFSLGLFAVSFAAALSLNLALLRHAAHERATRERAVAARTTHQDH
jgi:hypothetical protein